MANHEQNSLDQTNITDLAGKLSEGACLKQLYSRDWLKGQLLDLKVSLQAAKDEALVSKDLVEIYERVDILQDELFRESTDVAQKELIIERVQLEEKLLNNLFKVEKEKQGLFAGFVLEQAKLASEVLKSHKELESLQVTFENLKKGSFARMIQNRELMNELQQRNESLKKTGGGFDKCAKVASLKEKLENVSMSVQAQRHILQNLIISSGINWAQDAELKDVVLKAGRDLDENFP